MQTFREPGQRKLCTDVRQQMRHGNLSTNGRNVNDRARTAAHHVRRYRLDGMQRGKVSYLHGPVVGVDGLIAEWAYLNNGRIIDQNIHAAEHS